MFMSLAKELSDVLKLSDASELDSNDNKSSINSSAWNNKEKHNYWIAFFFEQHNLY